MISPLYLSRQWRAHQRFVVWGVSAIERTSLMLRRACIAFPSLRIEFGGAPITTVSTSLLGNTSPEGTQSRKRERFPELLVKLLFR